MVGGTRVGKLYLFCDTNFSLLCSLPYPAVLKCSKVIGEGDKTADWKETQNLACLWNYLINTY